MSSTNDNSALTVVPQAVGHVIHLLNEARKLNECLDSEAFPLDASTAMITTIIAGIASLVNVNMDSRVMSQPSTPTVGRYLRWINECYQILQSVLRAYNSTFSEIASSVGKNPPALGETIETVVSNYSNSGLGTEFIRKVTSSTGSNITMHDTQHTLKDRVWQSHLRAVSFIKCLAEDPLVQKTFKITTPAPHSGNQIKSILQCSAPLYADPYFHEWPVNSPLPANLVVNASATKFVHANCFVTLFKDHFVNFNVLTRKSCHSFVRMKLECGVAAKMTFVVTTKNGSSNHTIQTDAVSGTHIGWYVLPLPQESDNVQFSDSVCPGIGRIEVELFSEEMYYSNAATVDPTGRLITFQTGLTWADSFNASPEGSSDCHLLQNTIGGILSKRVGYSDFKMILEVYFAAFCNRRNWPAYYAEDRSLYCSPDDWDKFILPDIDRSLAARTLVNIADVDIHSSMGLAMTSDSYLAAFTARV
jgi:hypothetical protein